MKTNLKSHLAAGILLLAALGTATHCRAPQRKPQTDDRTKIVILSTNDMHATINEFPRLATAIRECRDTVFTIVADAGDRWTGDGFVDLAELRRPIIDLMNHVGYDVATLGNHEFDVGQKTLDKVLRLCRFKVLCANMKSDTELLDDIAGTTYILAPDSTKIHFAGVVTNYINGHPDGNDYTFEGLHFSDPQTCAAEQSAKMEGGVKVLLSHMGDDKDMELAARGSGYDIIIGGHTHAKTDTLINGTLVGQTMKKLKLVGVTRITLDGGRVADIEYENIPLKRYSKDAEVERMVATIKSNPNLTVVAGNLANEATHTGLANLQTKIIAEYFGADIGIYHCGGVRLEQLGPGEVTVKDIFDNEPFFSPVNTAYMTPAQLRKLIIAKYNDTQNPKESHRLDIFATTPYDLIVDDTDTAIDVLFPQLIEGRRYKVAMAEYIANNYPGLECDNMVWTQKTAYDLDLAYLKRNSPVTIDNTPKQRIVRKE